MGYFTSAKWWKSRRSNSHKIWKPAQMKVILGSDCPSRMYVAINHAVHTTLPTAQIVLCNRDSLPLSEAPRMILRSPPTRLADGKYPTTISTPRPLRPESKDFHPQCSHRKRMRAVMKK